MNSIEHTHAPSGHNHPHLDHPGRFDDRTAPLARDFSQRAFTVGVGGPAGTGKTALMLALCQGLRDEINLAAVTNYIFTREHGAFLICNQALAAERIRAVETACRPH